MNKAISMYADTIDAPVGELRSHLSSETRFVKWAKQRWSLTKKDLGMLYRELRAVQDKIEEKELALKARIGILNALSRMSIRDASMPKWLKVNLPRPTCFWWSALPRNTTAPTGAA